jgi:hypothetical protein
MKREMLGKLGICRFKDYARCNGLQHTTDSSSPWISRLLMR